MQRKTWMTPGVDAELRGEAEGFVGSWFKVNILRLNVVQLGVCNQVFVKYENFYETSDPGSPHLMEVVRQEVLRPLPPQLAQRRWAVREAVEAYYEEAWWVGFIRAYNERDDAYVVYFGRGEPDLTFPPSMLRTRQDYIKPSHSRTFEWKVFGFMKEPLEWACQDEAMQKVEVCHKLPAATLAPQPESYASSDHPQDSDMSWDEDCQRRERRTKKRAPANKRPATSKSTPPPRGPKKSLAKPKRKPASQPRVRELSVATIAPGSLKKSPVKPKSRSGKRKPASQPRATELTVVSIVPGSSSPPEADVGLHQLAYPSTYCDGLESSPSAVCGWKPRPSPETAEILQSTEHQGSGDTLRSSSLRTGAYLSVLKAFYSTGNLSRSQSELLQQLREELQISRLESTNAFHQVYGRDLQLGCT